MKRHPSLIALSREHHAALSLANRVKKAALAGDAAHIEAVRGEVVARFEAELAPHFAEEELNLLPRLAALGEAALVARTLDEHRALRALVRRLAAPAAIAETGDCLAEFGNLLAAHVRFEERELFERAQALHAQHGETMALPALPALPV
jgi:hemerythrin-like domain-containing protein